MGSGNQHGGRECDDLQNLLHMTLHENSYMLESADTPMLFHIVGKIHM